MSRTSLSDLVSSAEEFSEILNLASGIPFVDGPVGQAARFACRAWAGTPGYRLVFDALNIPNACAPYLDSIGRGVPSSTTPFSGGQCPGVRYVVTYTGTPEYGNGGGSGAPASVERVLVGPLVRERFGVRGADGTFIGQIVDASSGCQIGEPVPCPFPMISDGGNYAVRREDGQPDTCGDPPGEFQPGSGYEGESFGDTFVTNFNGNNYSVTVGVPVSIDGTISIPVDISGEVGDISLDFGPGGGVAELPAEGQSEIGGVVSPDQAGEGEPPPVSGKECVGIAVSILGDTSGFGIVPGGGSNDIFPRVVGNASLLLRPKGSSGPSFWSDDMRLYNEFSCKFRPEKGLTVARWRVKILDNIAHSVRPIYLEV